jgi:protein-tyrosine-phosphatase
MAEGFLRAAAGDRFEVESAGTEKTRVHPSAIRAMREVGIDIASHQSKTLDGFLNEPWDYVITVCDSANESCPIFPARSDACTGASRTRRGPPARKTSDSRSSGAFATRSRRASAPGQPS